MPLNEMKEPVGFKLRFHPNARDRAEDVARALAFSAVLEVDDALPPGQVVIDVSYQDGSVERDMPPERFLD